MTRLQSVTAGAARSLDRVRRRGELPVVLCVDVEPDLRVVDRERPAPWSGFESFLARLPGLRERLETLTGEAVAVTWFLRMDPQVAETWGSPGWVADAHRGAFDELLARGDELGLHTHTWRWSEGDGTWLADYADAAWARHCLAMGLEAYGSAFGRPCRAHRGGDHMLSGPMLEQLGEAGVRVDLSVEPGWPPVGAPDGERAAGLLPDYRNVPTRPFRSSASGFPTPDPRGGDPLLVPLFSPPALRRRHRLPLPPDSRHFVSRLALEMVREPPPVLALVLRSDPAAVESWDRVTANLEHLARHRGVRFLTASAAAEVLAAAGADRT